MDNALGKQFPLAQGKKLRSNRLSESEIGARVSLPQDLVVVFSEDRLDFVELNKKDGSRMRSTPLRGKLDFVGLNDRTSVAVRPLFHNTSMIIERAAENIALGTIDYSKAYL